jgi:hypothetical protein
VRYTPNGNVIIIANNYVGKDTLGNPDRKRFHTDDSIQVKYYDQPGKTISKAAFTFTFDAGCEFGGGVACHGGDAATPSQFFLGFMAYHRAWFDGDKYALTIGGGAIKNPGRYLVLVPPINGATAFSGTPYFTYNPATSSRPGTCRRRSITCRGSSSPSAASSTTGRRVCRTSADPKA